MKMASKHKMILSIWRHLLSTGASLFVQIIFRYISYPILIANLFFGVDYVRADSVSNKSVLETRKELAPTREQLLISLINEAQRQEKVGQLADSEKTWKRALELPVLSLQNEVELAAYIYSCLGRIQFLLDKYDEAEKSKRIAIKFYEKTVGQDDLRTSFEYQSIGAIYIKQKQWGKAEYFLEKALKTSLNKKSNEAQKQSLITKTNYAVLNEAQGQIDLAVRKYNEVLDILNESNSDDHGLRAVVLQNLGNIYSSQLHNDKSAKYYRESLEASKLIKNDSQGIEALSREKIAAHEIENKDEFVNAAANLNAALNKFKLAGRENTNDYARALRKLAYLYSINNKTDQAKILYAKSLAIYKTIKANESDLGLALLESALFEAKYGSISEAHKFAQNGLSYLFNALSKEAPLLEPNDRRSLINEVDDAMVKIFSFAESSKEGKDLSIYTRINRQGFLPDIEQFQAAIRDSPQKRILLEKYLKIVSKLNANNNLSTDKVELLKERETLKEMLFKETINQRKIVTKEQVIKALPNNSVLVEFQYYWPIEFSRISNSSKANGKYLALILKPDGSTFNVELGQSEVIDRLIQKALISSSESLNDSQLLWRKVSELLLKPLLPYVAESRQWYLTLDGELNRVPFAILPYPTDPYEPVGKVVQLRLLTASRDLIRLQTKASNSNPPFVIANPNYNSSAKGDTKQWRNNNSKISLIRPAGFGGNHRWQPLLNSEREGREIARILKSEFISGSSARVSALMKRKSPKILHVATHGYFLTIDDNKSNALNYNAVGLERPQVTGQKIDPLQLSGLVFAGANSHPIGSKTEGYLSSAEAVNLNLRGTELVVLSACSSGLGEVRTGEGIYGLQRALTVAGARSTLLSLWKVDDAATAVFMQRFYLRLKAGEGRSDALAAVQQEFRLGRVQSPSGADWKEPYYWAAWQLVGDWRPINGL